PAGRFPIRRLLYRPDRLAPPETGLPLLPLTPADGWCDDPGDPLYNRPVLLPYGARHERLWLASEVFGLILVLGHNDDPRPPWVPLRIPHGRAWAGPVPCRGPAPTTRRRPAALRSRERIF